MALAKGHSKIRCGPLTDHTKTAIFVAELLTKVSFNHHMYICHLL
jgi:RNA 3'-terminal phosphate cyclase (ATP)